MSMKYSTYILPFLIQRKHHEVSHWLWAPPGRRWKGESSATFEIPEALVANTDSQGFYWCGLQLLELLRAIDPASLWSGATKNYSSPPWWDWVNLSPWIDTSEYTTVHWSQNLVSPSLLWTNLYHKTHSQDQGAYYNYSYYPLDPNNACPSLDKDTTDPQNLFPHKFLETDLPGNHSIPHQAGIFKCTDEGRYFSA